MSERAPLVRRIDMLPAEPHGDTTGFFRALEDADGMVHERDELLCRCDELEALIEQVKQLHTKVSATYARSRDLCGTCGMPWPCSTIKLIGAAG